MIDLKAIWKGVWRRVVPVTSIGEALRIEIPVPPVMAGRLSLWDNMYADNAPWLHDDESPAVSTGLATSIAAEIARLATIESEISVKGSPRADYLDDQLVPVRDRLRRQLELGVATGGLILKPYVADSRIVVDFTRAGWYYPVSYDASGRLSGAVLLDQVTHGSRRYTRLEYHHMEQDGCVIENKAYMATLPLASHALGTPVSLSSVPEWEQLEPTQTIAGVDRLLFGHFCFPLANHLDPGSPLGVSAYSRAEGLIQQADQQWARILWEYEGAELAVHVDPTLLREDRRNKLQLPKGKARLYRSLPGLEEESKIFPYSPAIRDASLFAGYNNILKRIEYACALAYGTLSDPQQVDKTAEEIRASKQRSYALVRDVQHALEAALNDLVYAMDVWATIHGLAPRGSYEIACSWDDSIIDDPREAKAMCWQYVTAGKFPMWKYLVDYEGYTESEAKVLTQEAEGADITNPFGFADVPNAAVPTTADVQDTVKDVAGKGLNGAQTQSLLAVMEQYAAGALTLGQAINIIATAIGVSKDEAKAIIEGVE